jgi:MFS family permease
LRQHTDLKITLIGLVVAVATLIQFAGSTVGAVIAERIGYKSSMVIALILRVVGLTALALSAQSPIIVIAAIILVAACSAIYMPANKAYTVSSVPETQRPLILSLSSAGFNGGMAIGPLVSGALITSSPKILFLSIALLFLGLAVVHQKLLAPAPRPNTKPLPSHNHPRNPLMRVLYPFLTTVMAFYLYFLFQTFMGIHITEIASSQVWGSLLFLNFTILIATQVLGRKWISHIGFQTLAAICFLLFGSGFFLMSSQYLLFATFGTALMTVGYGAIVLRNELEFVSRIPTQPAVAFGYQRLATGVGGAASGVIGGVFYEFDFFWSIIVLQCFLAAGLIFAIRIYQMERPTYEATK